MSLEMMISYQNLKVIVTPEADWQLEEGHVCKYSMHFIKLSNITTDAYVFVINSNVHMDSVDHWL